MKSAKAKKNEEKYTQIVWRKKEKKKKRKRRAGGAIVYIRGPGSRTMHISNLHERFRRAPIVRVMIPFGRV